MKLIKYILLTIAFIFLFQESKGQCVAHFTTFISSLTVNFTGPSGTSTTYNWNFGDGNTNTGRTPVHTYATSGVYPVQLIYQNSSCTDTSIYYISVNTSPCPITAAISAESHNSFIRTMNSWSGGTNSTTTYLWHYGDGTTSTLENNNYSYNNPGVYYISLIATDTSGCSSSDNFFADVCMIHANFKDSVVGLTHHLTSTSIGLSTSATYSWDFGDGNFSALENPVHTYATAGNYSVILTVNDTNCFDSTSKSITASAACPVVASFTESSVGLTTSFTNTSTGISPTSTYFWRFGDGVTSTLENPVHTYIASGSYNVGLEVTDTVGGYCFDSVYTFVIVVGPPCPIVASFVETISGLSVSLSSTSTGLSGPGFYNWDFGDGSFSGSGASTSHTYSSQGVYSVSLTVSDSICSDTSTRIIAVTSNVFTPNGDGIDDVFILPCSGVAATVYNTSGILIKTLASGTFSWDGSNNLGGNEPTGLYFILCSSSSTPVSVTLIR